MSLKSEEDLATDERRSLIVRPFDYMLIQLFLLHLESDRAQTGERPTARRLEAGTVP